MEPTTMDANAYAAKHLEQRGPAVDEGRARAAPRRDRGATAVEYALLLSAITGVIVLAVTQLGTAVLGLFEKLHW